MLGTMQYFQTVDGQVLPFDIWNLVTDDRARIERLKQQGTKGVWQLRNIEIDVFLRLLAKIAHASAVSALGLKGFTPQLVDIISGDMTHAAQRIGELPGETAGLLPPSHYLHGLHQIAVGLHEREGVRYALVHLRLFSNLLRRELPYFTPSYAVIAGFVA